MSPFVEKNKKSLKRSRTHLIGFHFLGNALLNALLLRSYYRKPRNSLAKT